MPTEIDYSVPELQDIIRQNPYHTEAAVQSWTNGFFQCDRGNVFYIGTCQFGCEKNGHKSDDLCYRKLAGKLDKYCTSPN